MKKVLVMTAALGLVWVYAGGCRPHAALQKGDTRHELARTYGIDDFNQIEAIRFTFNVQVGAKNVRRAWLWKPHTGEVTFKADDQAPPVKFIHPLTTSSLNARLRAIDAKFVNDLYWLLFPLHLVWDTGAEVEDRGWAQRPLGAGQARRIEVRYPAQGGYTPGDVYELYVGDGGRIVEWVYRRGGAVQPTRMTTWEDHRRLGPLLLSLDHRGPDGFRVWFSDVALKLRQDVGWRYPET